MARVGVDVKRYSGRVSKSVVVDEIEDAYNNDCVTLVLVCANGWTSGADDAAEEEEDIDVYLVYPPDDMRELEDY